MRELETCLQESKADMDHIEKASVRQSVDMMSSIGEHSVAGTSRLSKLLHSPYFGCIDIIAPNKVFAHDLSQVLQELGEEMIQETTMALLAAEFLDFRKTDPALRIKEWRCFFWMTRQIASANLNRSVGLEVMRPERAMST